MAETGRKLTPKQERFVQEYLKDLNATRAADRAGYKHPNQQGPRLLVNVCVMEAITSAQAERGKRLELDQDYVLKRLRREANRTGDGSSHAARVKSLELLGKHLGMFPNRVQMGGDPDSPPLKSEHEIKVDARLKTYLEQFDVEANQGTT